MKNSLGVSSAALFGILAALIFCAAAFAQKVAVPPDTAAAATAIADTNAVPLYITRAEVAKLPPCSATLTKRVSEFGSLFTTAEGKQFVMGNIRGDQWTWHFAGALKVGQTYKFPDVVTNYLAATNYATAETIAAMTPCTATLMSRTPCSSAFVTPEGKWFGIGDPGSGATISHFIWTLKDGETCQFPDTFRDFVSAARYATAEAITAMTPRRATVVAGWDGEAYFKTADGKGFFIGAEEENSAIVSRFLRTLEEDKTYDLPDAFVRYQKQNKQQ